ncbi:hypothetical protein N5D66_05735 [Delftia tsuruhatensis]|uniref:hypothetical protein n=1 Tax=Delftia tsuruhatensis TaxID=180282 RepID=UPI00244CE5D2|nr:hypothetical protein [Delftia tsuruhatensis]MDH0847435.1 hypothetical protein [Delftia tsuruhatensis]
MTTAPTPAAAAIADLLEYLDDGGLHFDGQPLPDAAAIELRRLQAESERLLAQVHKLEMDALDLASENSILKRAETDELEARKPLPLSYRAGAMNTSVDGGATVSLHFNDMAEAEAWFVAITDQHDTALTSKATGPLPGSTGGSS